MKKTRRTKRISVQKKRERQRLRKKKKKPERSVERVRRGDPANVPDFEELWRVLKWR